jgi:hypothetical protein
MGASVMWLVAGGHAQCHLYGERAPILSMTDNAGASVTVAPSERAGVSVEHARFARELADAAARYATECELAGRHGGRRGGGVRGHMKPARGRVLSWRPRPSPCLPTPHQHGGAGAAQATGTRSRMDGSGGPQPSWQRHRRRCCAGCAH